jgi:probable phosphoglycerate mutase
VSADLLVLLRHGRTASNAEGRFQGQLNVPLDAVGLEQAEAAAEVLAGRLAADATQGRVRIVSSDLRRARETAEPLALRMALPVETDAGLRETSAGSWEGLLRQEIQERHPEDFARWVAGEDIRIGGGESRTEAGDRCGLAMRKHAEAMDGGTLVVVSHGASMRGGMLRLIGLPASAYAQFYGLLNCHWAEVRSRRDGWVLSSYNIGPLRGTEGADG